MIRKKVRIIDDPLFSGLVGTVVGFDGCEYSVNFETDASAQVGFDVTGLNFPFEEYKLEIVE